MTTPTATGSVVDAVRHDFNSIARDAEAVARRVAIANAPGRLVDDIVQEALLRAFKARAQFEGPSLSAWMGTITRRLCTDAWQADNRQAGLARRSRARNTDIDERMADETAALGSPETDPTQFADHYVPDEVPGTLSTSRCADLAAEAVGGLDLVGLVRPNEERSELVGLVGRLATEVAANVGATLDEMDHLALEDAGKAAAWESWGAKDVSHAANTERLRIRPVSTLAVVGVAIELMALGAVGPTALQHTLARHVDAIEHRLSDDVTALAREHRRGHAATEAAERVRLARSCLARLRPDSIVLDRLGDPVDPTLPLPSIAARAVEALALEGFGTTV